MTAPIRSMPELRDVVWHRVHEAIKAFDPVRYEQSGKDVDDLLQEIFEATVAELERGYKLGRRHALRKK